MTKPIYAVVDLETTGHSAKRGDRIIQIAIVRVQDGEILDTYNQFVNPEQPIPAFIAQLTNIQNELVAAYEPFEHYAKDVYERLRGTVFVAHNASFDLSFLQQEFERCGLERWRGEVLDTVELAKIMYPRASSYRLLELADELGIPLGNAHRADDDATATAQLLVKILKKMHTLPKQTLQYLHKHSFILKSSVSTLLYECLKEERESHSITLYKGLALKEPHHPVRMTETKHFPLEVDEQYALLQEINPSYERRPVQLNYMTSVYDALKQKQEVALEIPNGVGKTLGYLIPSVLYAEEMKRPVVISTYTNELVDALVEKEIKKLDRLFKVPVRVAVLKGREQYISLSKFLQVLTVTNHSYDETLTILQLIVWLSETETGDLSEVNVSGGGQLLLDRIRKRTHELSSEEKPFDFHQRAVGKAQDAQLVVTNHSLLLANHSYPFIHEACGLIIDEAHQMSSIAMRNVETVFRYTRWKYVIGQLIGEGEYDLLTRLTTLFERKQQPYKSKKRQLIRAYDQLVDQFDLFIRQLVQQLKPNRTSTTKHTVHLDATVIHQLSLQSLHQAMFLFLRSAQQFIEPLEHLYLVEKERAFVQEWQDWVTQYEQKMDDWIELFTVVPQSTEETFIEYDERSVPGSVVFVKKPITSAPLLRSFVHSLKEESFGIVWTSGTLRVPSYESFIPKQLGLPEDVPIETFPAPSSFYDHASIWLVEDMPQIDEVKEDEYIELVADSIVQTTYATAGNVFVLFTSQQMLQKTVHLIQDSELLEEHPIFAQGVTSGSDAKLLKLFHQTEGSLLFGTNQFWEGLDVRDESVRAVIVVRLPFSSPKDPLYRLRSEQLASENGGHPFYDYGLPEALVRFRQGFTRLMRRTEGRTSFILLDKRLETKQYGHYFIDSLPQLPIRKVNVDSIVGQLSNWYGGANDRWKK